MLDGVDERRRIEGTPVVAIDSVSLEPVRIAGVWLVVGVEVFSARSILVVVVASVENPCLRIVCLRVVCELEAFGS